MDDKFWTDDPLVLLSEYDILPLKHLSTNQKLNALTRALLLAALIMYGLEYKHWFTFLIIGIIIILVIKLMSDARQRCSFRHTNKRGIDGNSARVRLDGQTDLKEGFSIPPTYIDGAEPMTTIPPSFAEEWQIPPPIYDEYTNIGNQAQEKCTAAAFAREGAPCGMSKPYNDDRPIYGQYIIANDLMPYQSGVAQHMPLNEARLYMNDEFTKDALQFRNDMTRNVINKMDRIYKNGCSVNISSPNY